MKIKERFKRIAAALISIILSFIEVIVSGIILFGMISRNRVTMRSI